MNQDVGILTNQNFITKNNKNKIYFTDKFLSFIERNKFNNKYINGNAYLIGSNFIHNNNSNILIKQYVYILKRFNNGTYLVSPIKNVSLLGSKALNNDEINLGIIPEINQYKLSIIDLNYAQIVKESKLNDYVYNVNKSLNGNNIKIELQIDKKYSKLINKRISRLFL